MEDLRRFSELLHGESIETLSKEAPAVAYEAFHSDWLFHHTERVVFWSQRLAEEKNLRGDSFHAVTFSAWVHDIGRTVDPERHAEIGAVWVEELLRSRGVPENIVSIAVDAVRNHGTSATPKTDTGHILRLADALAVCDPMFVGMYAPVLEEEDRKKVLKMVEKKWKVVEEYGREDLIDLRTTIRLLEG